MTTDFRMGDIGKQVSNLKHLTGKGAERWANEYGITLHSNAAQRAKLVASGEVAQALSDYDRKIEEFNKRRK